MWVREADRMQNLAERWMRYMLRTHKHNQYSWIPGWFHAFYIEYIYIERRLQASHGMLEAERAPFIFSKRVQTGGRKLMAMQPLPPLMQPQLGAKSQAQPQPVLQATVPTTAGVVSMAVE